MNHSEIQDRIYKLIEDLDKLTPDWAKAKADKSYSDEMKKVVLNTAKSASDAKTAAEREQEAYTSEEYKKYLWKAFEVDGKFFELDGKKSLFEKELDSMRSLLSFEKNQIDRTL